MSQTMSRLRGMIDAIDESCGYNFALLVWCKFFMGIFCDVGESVAIQ